MTKEERIELLKLARQAKLNKKLERDEAKPEVKRGRKKKEVIPEPDINPEPEQEPEPEPEQEPEPVIEDPVKKPKPKKIKEPVNTLTLDLPTDQPDIIYETEIRRRPKKKIVKRIVYEDDSDDSIEEEIIDNRKKKSEVKKIVKPVKLNENKNENIIREPEPVKKESSFSFFNC